MTKLSDYAILLIGFSFLFLLINKIAFGASLILGIVILIFLNLEIIVKQSKRILKKISMFEILITCFFLFFFFYFCSFINQTIQILFGDNLLKFVYNIFIFCFPNSFRK